MLIVRNSILCVCHPLPQYIVHIVRFSLLFSASIYKFCARGMYVLGTMTIPQYYEKGQYLYMVSTSPMYTVSTPPLHISPIHTVKTKGQYISTSIKLYVVDIRGRRKDLSRRSLFCMVYSGMRSQLKVFDIFVRTADNSENPVFGLIDSLFFC